MATGRILVLIDGTKESLFSVDFALRFFNYGGNKIIGLSIEEEADELEYGGLNYGRSELDGVNLAVIQNKTVRDELSNILIDVKAALESRFSLKQIHWNERTKLYNEIKYADLIVSTEEAYARIFDNIGQEMPESILRCCPRLMLNEPIHETKSVVILNDGSAESAYAIKNYCRFFGHSCSHLDVTLFNYLEDTEHVNEESADLKMLSSYLQTHCNKLAFMSYKKESNDFIQRMLQTSETTLIVGSRGAVENTKEIFSYAKHLVIDSVG